MGSFFLGYAIIGLIYMWMDRDSKHAKKRNNVVYVEFDKVKTKKVM